MSIWYKKHTLAALNALATGTLMEALEIRFTEIGEDYLSATMPVDRRTFQPAGLLHGGASVALAESLGSMASHLVVDPGKFRCVGIEVNANHTRAAKSGVVTGTARPAHLGRSTHVWEIRIADESGRTVCLSRLTMAILGTPEN